MTDKEIIQGLDSIINQLEPIIDELLEKNGVISTEILDRFDTINELSVSI